MIAPLISNVTGVQKIVLCASIFILGCIGMWSWMQEMHSDMRALRACARDLAHKDQCYAVLVRTVEETRGLSAAFDVVEQMVLFERSVDVRSDFFKECHAFTHEIGRIAYRDFAHTGTLPVIEKGDLCSYGFYHGFMETLIQEGGTPQEARRFCDEVASISREKELGLSAPPCYHGIGHGAVDGFGPAAADTIEGLIQPGKDLCQFVGEGDNDRVMWCLTGAFHSLAHMFEYETHGLSMSDPNFDPYAVCKEQDSVYEKKACYQQMRSVAMAHTRGDFARALMEASATEEAYAIWAVDGLAEHEAQQYALQGTAQEYETIIGNCRSLPQEQSLMCVQSFGAGLAMYGSPHSEEKGALSFCLEQSLSEPERNVCVYRVMYTLRKMLPQDRIQDICARDIPAIYKPACTH